MTGLPVHVLYDADKVFENSNISRDVVVSLGSIGTRSDHSHNVGRRLWEREQQARYANIQGRRVRVLGDEDIHGLTYPDPDPTILRLLKIEDPKNPGRNHCDQFLTNVLRMTRGVNALGSTQATTALGSRGQPGIYGDGVAPALNPTPGGQQVPQTPVQIAIMTGQEAARQPAIKRFIGLNGKR